MATGRGIAQRARNHLGAPYIWGAEGPTSFDCSGLVQYVYRKAGISLPRVTYDQINVGHSVRPGKLRPGDLVFFDTDRSRRGPDHVGIYVGGGKFIHAPKPGDHVKISSLSDSYYMSRWMGGRRIPGVQAGGGGGAGGGGWSGGGGSAEPAAPRLDKHELAERYGMSFAFFKSQPELMKLLNGAVADQWSADKFQAKLRNTRWWKKHADSVRQAQILQKTDPATYKAKMEAARVAARQMAVEVGAILPGRRVDELAKNMVWYGWEDAQVANFLGQHIKFFEKGTMGGVAGQAYKEMRQQAFELGVSVTDQSLKNNAQYLVRGLTSKQKIEASMREQAAGLYPAFAEQIKAGASMNALAQPYVQVLAEELALPETDINIFSPKVKRALNRVDDRGEPAPMDLHDFTQMVRDDPRWRQTPGTAERAFSVGRQVLADMGLGA